MYVCVLVREREREREREKERERERERGRERVSMCNGNEIKESIFLQQSAYQLLGLILNQQ